MELQEFKEQVSTRFANRFADSKQLDSFAEQAYDYIITPDGYINIGFEDVESILDNAKSVALASTTGPQDDLYKMLVEVHDKICKEKASTTPVNMLMQIQFDHSSGFSIDKTKYINEFIETLDADVDIIWGIAFDNTLGEDLRVTLIEGFE